MFLIICKKVEIVLFIPESIVNMFPGQFINVAVITSYSIHYTKLYEEARKHSIVENADILTKWVRV